MRQQLKINGIWAVLPANFKVTIKRTNPLFNTEGDFSFPFNMSVAENRAIIQSAADPHGRFALRRLNGLPVEYWFDGQLLFRGYTEVKSSVQFKDTISLNFVSGIKSITERVKDMKANEVSVERMQIGYACTGLRYSDQEASEIATVNKAYIYPFYGLGYGSFVEWLQYKNLLCPAADTGYVAAPVKNALYFTEHKINVSEDCRTKPYCNTRVALPYPKEGIADMYRTLDANRRDAAPCMFVLYWLRRLFVDLNISSTNEVEDFEDMRRLAFFSAFPKYETPPFGTNPTESAVAHKDERSGEVDYFAPWEGWAGVLADSQYSFGLPYHLKHYFSHSELRLEVLHYSNHDAALADPLLWQMEQNTKIPAVTNYENTTSARTEFAFRPAYLSSQQYPDEKIQTILDDLHNIFGLRIIYDTVTNHARICYIKDIMSDTPTKTLPCEFVGEPLVTRDLNPGIIVTYGKDRDEKDMAAASAAFDFEMPPGIVDEATGKTKPNPALVKVQPYTQTVALPPVSTDTTTYYDSLTCNVQRVMVDDESEEYDQGAQYFEAGAWNDYRQNVTDEENAQVVKASFEPVSIKDISFNIQSSVLVPFANAEQAADDKECYETLLHDGEKQDSSDMLTWHRSTRYAQWTEFLSSINYKLYYTRLTPWADGGNELFADKIVLRYAYNNGELCNMTASDSPLQKWQDEGHYVLGFMRGPGNAGGTEQGEYNADGTAEWRTVVGTPTFTADSVDQLGNVFDYNGTAAGGIDQSQRLSLKLEARKAFGYDEDGNPDFYPCDNPEIAKRGVVAKMLGEYLYFMSNKKTVTHRANVAIGAVMNIDWCAYYPLHGNTGFINSIQLELSENGVGESTIEQYTL